MALSAAKWAGNRNLLYRSSDKASVGESASDGFLSMEMESLSAFGFALVAEGGLTTAFCDESDSVLEEDRTGFAT